MKQYNIFVCGVGGQGVITLAMFLKRAGVPVGYRVVGGEYRGAAQREGPVTATVRYGIPEAGETYADAGTVFAGNIIPGGAHLVLSTEASEALRYPGYLSPDTTIVSSSYIMPPKGTTYPKLEEIEATLKEVTQQVYYVDTNGLSMSNYGSYRMANTVLLGAALAVSDLPLTKANIEAILERQTDLEALRLGLQAGEDARLKVAK